MYRTLHLKNKFRTVEVNYVQSRYYRDNVVTVNPGNKTIYGGLLYLMLSDNNNLVYVVNETIYINNTMFINDDIKIEDVVGGKFYYDKDYDLFTVKTKKKNIITYSFYIAGEMYGPFRRIERVIRFVASNRTFVLIYTKTGNKGEELIIFEIKNNQIISVKVYDIEDPETVILVDYTDKLNINSYDQVTNRIIYHDKKYKPCNNLPPDLRVTGGINRCERPDMYCLIEQYTNESMKIKFDKRLITFNYNKIYNDIKLIYNYTSDTYRYEILCCSEQFNVILFTLIKERGYPDKGNKFLVINERIFGPFKDVAITYMDEKVVKGAFIYYEQVSETYSVETSDNKTVTIKYLSFATSDYRSMKYTFTYELGKEYLEYCVVDGSEYEERLMSLLFHQSDLSYMNVSPAYQEFSSIFSELVQDDIYFISINQGIDYINIKDRYKIESISQAVDRIIKTPYRLNANSEKPSDIHLNGYDGRYGLSVQINDDVYSIKAKLISISVVNKEYYFFINDNNVFYIISSNGNVINVDEIIREQIYNKGCLFDLLDACVLKNKKIVLIARKILDEKSYKDYADIIVIENNKAKFLYHFINNVESYPFNLSSIKIGYKRIDLYNNLDSCYIMYTYKTEHVDENKKQEQSDSNKTSEDEELAYTTYCVKIE